MRGGYGRDASEQTASSSALCCATLQVRELRKIVGNDIAIAIAGNKVDLEKNRHVVEKDALAYAQSVNATHHHTSAKLNKGLDVAFTDLARSKCLFLSLAHWR